MFLIAFAVMYPSQFEFQAIVFLHVMTAPYALREGKYLRFFLVLLGRLAIFFFGFDLLVEKVRFVT